MVCRTAEQTWIQNYKRASVDKHMVECATFTNHLSDAFPYVQISIGLCFAWCGMAQRGEAWRGVADECLYRITRSYAFMCCVVSVSPRFSPNTDIADLEPCAELSRGTVRRRFAMSLVWMVFALWWLCAFCGVFRGWMRLTLSRLFVSASILRFDSFPSCCGVSLIVPHCCPCLLP